MWKLCVVLLLLLLCWFYWRSFHRSINMLSSLTKKRPTDPLKINYFLDILQFSSRFSQRLAALLRDDTSKDVIINLCAQKWNSKYEFSIKLASFRREWNIDAHRHISHRYCRRCPQPCCASNFQDSHTLHRQYWYFFLSLAFHLCISVRTKRLRCHKFIYRLPQVKFTDA